MSRAAELAKVLAEAPDNCERVRIVAGFNAEHRLNAEEVAVVNAADFGLHLTAPGFSLAARYLNRLIELKPALVYCGCKQKGHADKTAWQREKYDAFPAEWAGRDWFCVQPHSAGAFLVDLDAVTDEARLFDSEKGRPATVDEAKELAERLGGRPLIYESTPGKGKFHLLYPAIDLGGQGRNIASQAGLLMRLRSGDFAQFDVRGGGAYLPHHCDEGEQSGARIDADARRLSKLIKVATSTDLAPPDVDVVAKAMQRRQESKRTVKRYKDPQRTAPSRHYATRGDRRQRPAVNVIEPYGGGGVHDHILAQTSRIVRLAGFHDHERLLAELERGCQGLPRQSEGQNLKQEIRNAYNGALRRWRRQQ